MRINLVGGPDNGMAVTVNPDRICSYYKTRDKLPAPMCCNMDAELPAEPLMCKEYTYRLRYTLDNIPFYEYAP